jgi:GLPGLI family protein
MVLFVGDQQSYFSSTLLSEIDSIETLQAAGNSIAKSTKKITASNLKFRVLKTDDDIIYSDLIFRERFHYVESKSNIVWKIHPDILNIQGLSCQKATTQYGGRNWTAWFASSIPIFDGPYKFSGLPGLIVQIHDGSNYFIFNLINFKPAIGNIDLIRMTNSTEISRNKYFEVRKKFRENPF